MRDYFATFPSGCQQIVAQRLQKIPNAQLIVHDVQDGLVLFASSLSHGQLSELRFFTNVFQLLADLGQQESIESAACAAMTADMSDLPLKAGFVVHVRVASQPTSLKALSNLQHSVSAANGGQPDSFKPDIALLLWLRADNHALWGWQLPVAGYKHRRIEAGELRPELAHIMGLLAGLTPKQVVLDPFAGYGAIVRECLQGFHCEHVLAVEHNEHLVPHLKAIPRLVAKQGDAARLPHIQTHSVDRVITDPPWGKFAQASPEHLQRIYYESMQHMHRVLRAKGCIVMLTSVEFLPDVAAETGFAIEKQYNILVSGQKATLYKLRKLA